MNRTSKACELDGEWQCLLLVCRQTCLLQSVSLKASAKCLSRRKAIVLVSSPLRSQTAPFLSLYLPLAPLLYFDGAFYCCECMWVCGETVLRQCVCERLGIENVFTLLVMFLCAGILILSKIHPLVAIGLYWLPQNNSISMSKWCYCVTQRFTDYFLWLQSGWLNKNGSVYLVLWSCYLPNSVKNVSQLLHVSCCRQH